MFLKNIKELVCKLEILSLSNSEKSDLAKKLLNSEINEDLISRAKKLIKEKDIQC